MSDEQSGGLVLNSARGIVVLEADFSKARAQAKAAAAEINQSMDRLSRTVAETERRAENLNQAWAQIRQQASNVAQTNQQAASAIQTTASSLDQATASQRAYAAATNSSIAAQRELSRQMSSPATLSRLEKQAGAGSQFKGGSSGVDSLAQAQKDFVANQQLADLAFLNTRKQVTLTAESMRSVAQSFSASTVSTKQAEVALHSWITASDEALASARALAAQLQKPLGAGQQTLLQETMRGVSHHTIKDGGQGLPQQINAAANVAPQINAASNSMRGLGFSMRGVAAGFGLVFGAESVGRVVQFGVEVDKVATSYKRQSLAARELAGSQSRVNEFMRVYDEATGETIGRAQRLADITKLMAVGFGDSTKEIEQFARAVRGISIATGRPSEFIVTQLQLELLNQTGFRLDQIGLDMQQVNVRAKELSATNSDLTKSMAYQQAVLEIANEKFGKLTESAEAQRTGLERLGVAWEDLRLSIGEGNQLLGIGSVFDYIAGRIEYASGVLDEFNERMKIAQLAAAVGVNKRTAEGLARSIELNAARGERGGKAKLNVNPNQEEIDKLTTEAYVRIKDVEADAARDRLEAVRDYEQQRADVIRDFGLNMVRQEQDFALQRARAEEDHLQSINRMRRDAAASEQRMFDDLQRGIADAQADSADRIAKMQRDHDRQIEQQRQDSADRILEWEEDRDEQIAERRQDSADRLIEIEADYQRQRERSERDSRERIRDAAARLDARAVYEEQRRQQIEAEDRLQARDEAIRDENKKLNEGIDDINKRHQERLEDEEKAQEKSRKQAESNLALQIADEKTALDKRLGQQQEAFDLQLAAARAADEQRYTDMVDDFTKTKDRQDADRLIQLGRQQTDHNEQLLELNRQHSARITQIQQHAQAERDEITKELEDDLAQIDGIVNEWDTRQQKLTEDAIKYFDLFWTHVNSELSNPKLGVDPSKNPVDNPPPTTGNKQQIETATASGWAAHNWLQTADPNMSSGLYADTTRRLAEIERQLAAWGVPIPWLASASGASSNDSIVETAGVSGLGGLSSGGGGGRNVSVSFAPGAFQITGITGQTAQELYRLIDERLAKSLRDAINA